MGFQTNVDRWLISADIVLVPSHVEPLGNATLEAMAHSRPVIGTQVGGIPEMILAEETGVLVPPRDPAALAAAIGRLLDGRNLREQLGAAARQRCEKHFSLTAHTDAVLRQYETVLAGESKPRPRDRAIA
jgi:glycosyltransferase involved in cell wall biosynthesis